MAEEGIGTPAPAASTKPAVRKMGFWLLMVAVVTLLAGLLFGYDQGVISGALPLIAKDLNLSTLLKEVVTSWVTLGALVGALIAGTLADRLGRRVTAITAGVLFCVGAILEAVTPGVFLLVVGRLITGLAVGFASTAAPLYAAEMAPKRMRGRFVSTYQLAITIGIFVAYIVDDLLTESGNWRLMFALAIVPGVMLIVGFLVMPETPRWLLKMGRRPEAEKALVKIEGEGQAETDLDLIDKELKADLFEGKASWSEVFSKALRRPLMVGVGLAIFQQITGINAIIYYANEIFAKAGFTTAAQQATATLYAIGLVNVLATFIAIAFVDRFGRRPLLFAGLVGMGVSLTTVGIAFAATSSTPTTGGGTSVAGILTLVALVVFIASFAFSLGPVVWTIISEIYPNRVRGRAVAVATAANWGAAFLVTQFFLTLVDAIGESGTFFLFAFFSAVAFWWIWRNVPETKGKSLEQIQDIWINNEPIRGLYGSPEHTHEHVHDGTAHDHEHAH